MDRESRGRLRNRHARTCSYGATQLRRGLIPRRAALDRNAHLVELDALIKSASWPRLEKALTHYGECRFLGTDRFQAEARTVEATLREQFPGAIRRVVASLKRLSSDDALSRERGIKLSAAELERIVALTEAGDFDEVVHHRRGGA